MILESYPDYHSEVVGWVLSVIFLSDCIVSLEGVFALAEDVVALLAVAAQVCIRVEAVVCACRAI